MYIGLTLTSASSYQMLRGALIVCTGLLSIFCLHSTIKAYQWMGMISVVLGDLLCILAQLVSAVQLVFEQKYMRQYDVDPLLAVGLEGELRTA
ncbi:unnamed protein product [Nippostrongylus brasiliensis]|uniref:Solute carrier family 35 member F6 (inferred by orthology to a human protein) n=1 Tax=Nippostrongylus brasiliensis TaxID=27835 RepID=A0A0N4YFR6_NIPBR|nr:unnamed protein product [Nippostrongylus brasiliensis]